MVKALIKKKIKSQGVPSGGSTNVKDLVFCHIPQALLFRADTDRMRRTHVVAGGRPWLHPGVSLLPRDKVSCKTAGADWGVSEQRALSVTMTVRTQICLTGGSPEEKFLSLSSLCPSPSHAPAHLLLQMFVGLVRAWPRGS